MFKLKDKSTLFGINKEASTDSTPVFEKNLAPGVQAEANRDGTIFVQKGMSQKQINNAVEHEKVHLDQMSFATLNLFVAHPYLHYGIYTTIITVS